MKYSYCSNYCRLKKNPTEVTKKQRKTFIFSHFSKKYIPFFVFLENRCKSGLAGCWVPAYENIPVPVKLLLNHRCISLWGLQNVCPNKLALAPTAAQDTRPISVSFGPRLCPLPCCRWTYPDRSPSARAVKLWAAFWESKGLFILH